VTRVLVCGGRGFDDYNHMRRVLSNLHQTRGIERIIEGGAPGADRLAYRFGAEKMIVVEHYPADWRNDGRAAGPIRNQRMIDEGKPDLVVAFPGGRGTADMMRRSRAAGVEVIEVEAE
jgi:hypothetical protein